MTNDVVNYDGSVHCSPRQLVYPHSVEEIQAVMRDAVRYPSPVRAMGSYHSLTPCASSDGTMVNMSQMARVVKIDSASMTMMAQARLQVIDGAGALRAQ